MEIARHLVVVAPRDIWPYRLAGRETDNSREMNHCVYAIQQRSEPCFSQVGSLEAKGRVCHESQDGITPKNQFIDNGHLVALVKQVCRKQ